MTFGPALYLESLYRINSLRNVQYSVYFPDTPIPTPTVYDDYSWIPREIAPGRSQPTPLPQKTFFGQLTGGNKVELLSPVSAQFGIIIPKIGANAKIIPNVDAGKSESYLPALQDGVAHAAGTVFPGVASNIYLFAHSTDAFWNVGRYNAVFYLLKELENGDEINIFYLGKRHIYKVTDKKIVDPSEIQYLTEQTPYEQLTLQTCWPPGTTLKRLIIIARPEKDITANRSRKD